MLATGKIVLSGFGYRLENRVEVVKYYGTGWDELGFPRLEMGIGV